MNYVQYIWRSKVMDGTLHTSLLSPDADTRASQLFQDRRSSTGQRRCGTPGQEGERNKQHRQSLPTD